LQPADRPDLPVPLRALSLAGLAALAALMATPALACYTVYDAADRVVYQAQTPPVDMRFQIHEVLPRVYPGGHLVFGNEQDCPLVNTRSVVATAAVADASTLRPRGGAYAPKPDRN
jgi:hypothetical protein